MNNAFQKIQPVEQSPHEGLLMQHGRGAPLELLLTSRTEEEVVEATGPIYSAGSDVLCAALLDHVHHKQRGHISVGISCLAAV